MRCQAEGLTKEYDRLLEEHAKLQVRVKAKGRGKAWPGEEGCGRAALLVLECLRAKGVELGGGLPPPGPALPNPQSPSSPGSVPRVIYSTWVGT